jgi:hypothetical protein
METKLDAQVRSVKTDPKCWAGLEFAGIAAKELARRKRLIESFAVQKKAS